MAEPAHQAVAGEVDRDRAQLDLRGRPGRRDDHLLPAEVRPDPRLELAQAERLGHVVVRAHLQADHLVDLRSRAP